jgi:hypothetical protein
MLLSGQVGVELVPLLKEMPTGKPRKDPATGYLMNHSLPSTDVTKSADVNRFEQRAPDILRKNANSAPLDPSSTRRTVAPTEEITTTH